MKRTDITNLFPEATDEQVKSLMDINGADINNAKKNYEELQKTLTEREAQIAEMGKGAEELKSVQDRADALQSELDGMKAAEELRVMRERVAKETGVPVDLLTNETEEACKAQADAIKTYANPKYPNVPDGGETNPTVKKSTAEQFADWLNEQQK